MSKKLIVVAPAAAKVENVEVVSLTVAELVVLINNSKKVELTAEQIAGCKSSMATICQKFVTGEKITADENVIMQFVASLTKKAVHAGQTEAEKAEAKKLAEGTYKTEVQAFEIQVAEKFGSWYNKEIKFGTNENETDSSLTFVKLSKDALKTSFADFLKSLPTEPKKPGATKREGSAHVSDGSTVEKKHMTDVSNLQPGTKKTVWDAIVAAKNGITQTELEKVVQTAFPEKTEALNKSNVYKALYYLPEFISDGKLFAATKVA